MSTRVLIGIPSFRRPERLRTLLRSLAKQERVADCAVELFVADNDSSAREATSVCRDEAPGFPWPLDCDVVPERGISAARNRILAEARARRASFLAMLDDDEVADPCWLAELLAMQRRTAADAVGGLVRFDIAGDVDNGARGSGYFAERRLAAGEVPLLHGAGNILLCCESLGRLGWPQFDQRFATTGGEDAEYFLRLRSKGFRFAWAPAAVVTEQVESERLSARAILRRAFRTGNNDVRMRTLNGQLGGAAASLAKGAALIVGAPLLSPLLLARSRRLWLLAKWASSLGRFSALLDRAFEDYGDGQEGAQP